MRSGTLKSIQIILSILVCTAAFTPTRISRKAYGAVAVRDGPLFMSSEESDAVEESLGNLSDDSIEESTPVKCPNCDLCDGSGRIVGGLGAIELFSWWPIKAYRPCPNFINNGGQYIRSGQGLDEIAFGRDSSYNPDEM